MKPHLIFLMLCPFALYAQSSTARRPLLERSVIEERLVSLAWENTPANKALVYRAEDAHKIYKQGLTTWLDMIRIQGNLNEFTMNPENFIRSQYFPRYNFSIAFTLGDFTSIPQQNRTKRVDAEVARLSVDSQRIYIKSEVLRRYNHYLSVRNRLEIQKKLESEIGVNLELARSKFTQGNETYDVLSGLVEKYYNLQLTTRELEEGLGEATLNLEEMIGVKLESVLYN